MSEERRSYEAMGFKGKVSRTRTESQPCWPAGKALDAAAPNIVIVYMDDMGYSDPGCFGSEIDTPNIDALAARGLRFNHYTTHPICSPARAALLTGRNAHAVGTGWLANNHSGFPGYTGRIPADVPTIAETLRSAGYSTAMVGKWHNTPGALSLPSSPKDSWPTQRGFDFFYGFMEGETSYFFPARLMTGNTVLPIDEYQPDYYATDDWTRQAIRFIRDQRSGAPRKPFFLYIAHNAVHAPFQAREKDIAKYRGCYDPGWGAIREARFRRQLEMGLIPPGTRLAPSDPTVPKWESIDPRDRPLFARHMETYAGMLDCVDQNVGALVACLQELGELDNTIILFSSDNGAAHAGPLGATYCNRKMSDLPETSIEFERARAAYIGGRRSNALYPTGWGEVSNTPFPTFKTYTGGGGRRVSFILSWPRLIRDSGAVRTQLVHVTDVMPTLLELARIEPVKPMDGRSFAAVLREPEAPAPREEQYYECWSNRAFYRGGWLARSLQKRGEPIAMHNWTLHDLREDFSESVDLRGRYPEKLAELTEAFDRAAWLHLVYPLDNRTSTQKFMDSPADATTPAAASFLPCAQTVHRAVVVPLVSDRSFRIRARFAWQPGEQGVLWAIGEQIAGIVAYVESGHLRCFYNGFGEFSELPPVVVPVGENDAVLEYEATGKRAGRGRVVLNGAPRTDWRPLSPTLMWGMHEGLDIGIDRRAPVSWEVYEKYGSFPFGGAIRSVTIEPGSPAPDSLR